MLHTQLHSKVGTGLVTGHTHNQAHVAHAYAHIHTITHMSELGAVLSDKTTAHIGAVHIYVCTHTQNTHTHTHIHTHTYTYTHKHTYMKNWFEVGSFV